MNAPKKVLVLVHTFPPFGTVGGSIRLLKSLNFMNRGEGGWQPTVVTLDPEMDLLWLAKASEHSLKEIPSDVRLVRVDSNEPKNPRVGGAQISKLLRKIKLLLLLPLRVLFLAPDEKRGFGPHLEKAALDEIAEKDYSLIYATSPPFSVLLTAIEVKRKTGLPLILEIKDDWVQPNQFLGLRWHRRFIESRMERKCMASADRVITVTRKSCEGYKSRYPEFQEKFICIPNGCDVSEYQPYWSDAPASFDKFTLIHSGVITGTRNLAYLFSALKRLILSNEGAAGNIEFIVIGNIPRSQKKEISRHSLWDVVTNVDYMEREKYVETLVKAHLPVVVNFTDPALVPGKLYEYWGSRNKMLLLDTVDSAAGELVTTYQLGDVVGPDDEEAIYQSLSRSYDAWLSGELEQNDVSGLGDFDRKFLTGKLEDAFAEVAND